MNLKELLKSGQEFAAVNKKGEKATLQGLMEAGQVLVTFDGSEEPKAYKWSTVERGQGWKVIEEEANTADAPVESSEEAPVAPEEAPEVSEENNEEEVKMVEVGKFAKYGEEVVLVDAINGKMVTVIDKNGEDAPAHIEKLEPIELTEEEAAAWKAGQEQNQPQEPSEEDQPKKGNGGGRKTDVEWKSMVFNLLEDTLEGLKIAKPGFTKVKKVGDRNYLAFGAGTTGLTIFLSINRKDITIELFAKDEARDFVEGIVLEGYNKKVTTKHTTLQLEIPHTGNLIDFMGAPNDETGGWDYSHNKLVPEIVKVSDFLDSLKRKKENI